VATDSVVAPTALQPRVVVVIVPVRSPATRGTCAPSAITPLAACWLLCGPLVVLLLFVAGGEAAWEVRLVPEVALGAEYSDNVTYATKQGQQIDDLSFVATPALTWSADRQDFRLDGRSDLRAERFLEQSNLDGEDWGHRLGATWRLNERWTLSANEDWRQSRNLDDFIAAGEIVVQRERRTTNEARAAVTWLPTEHTQASLSYTNYNSQSEHPANTDYLLHAVTVSLSLQATEKLGLFTGANVQDYDFNPSPSSATRFFTRNYGLFLGGGYQLTERLSTNMQIGGRLTEQTVRGLALDVTTFPVTLTEVEDTTSNTGETFDLSATYQLERGRIEVHASQDLSATAGAEGTVERRSLGLSTSNWVASDWQWNTGLTYTENKSDAAQTGFVSRDSSGTYLTLGLRYRINDYLDASAQLRRSDYRDASLDTETERNAVVFTVTGRWPQLL